MNFVHLVRTVIQKRLIYRVRAGHLKRRLGVDITKILQQHNEFNDNSDVYLYLILPCGKP